MQLKRRFELRSCTTATYFGVTKTCAGGCCGYLFADDFPEQSECFDNTCDSPSASQANGTYTFKNNTAQSTCPSNCFVSGGAIPRDQCIPPQYAQACQSFPPSSGLSAAAIAGICVGSVAFLLLIILGVIYCKKKGAQTQNPETEAKPVTSQSLGPLKDTN